MYVMQVYVHVVTFDLQQSQLKPGSFWERPLDLDQLDDHWDQPSYEKAQFPFQNKLFQFLDTRAPIPGVKHVGIVSTILRCLVTYFIR